LAADQRFHAFRHPIKVLAEQSNFIPAFVQRWRNPSAEMAVCDLACSFAQLN
jgi:hypothetical protein